jgi:hypothetical protein
MNCCDSNGVCTQGQDCAIRKQKVVNDAYINGKIDNNPYDETLGSFSELVAVIVVATAVGLLAYVVWGML